MTMRNNHTTVTSSSGNIFADLGLPNADEHLFKAQIVAIIDASIRGRQLTQAAAAQRMGLKQPDVSKLLKGRYEGFSLERLFYFLMMLGHELKLEVAEAPANDDYAPGHLRLAHCGV